MALNTAIMYNESEYSDIIIKFSDREVRCHKMILCKKSEYFKKLCGPGSQFAESKQSTIELKDDDPDALQAMLLYLYTDQHISNRDDDWVFQLELSKTAKKYLFPGLSAAAARKFRFRVKKISNVQDIYMAIEHIRQHAYESEDLSLADTLEQQHLVAFTELDDYRELLSQDPTRLQKCLQALTGEVDLLRTRIRKAEQVHVKPCRKCEPSVNILRAQLSYTPPSSFALKR